MREGEGPYLVEIVILADQPLKLALNIDDFLGRKLELHDWDSRLFQL